MEVVEQLETLKFDNGRAPGSPSTAGPQPGPEEPAGGEEPGPKPEEPAGGEEPGPGLEPEEPVGGEETGPGPEEPAGGEGPGPEPEPEEPAGGEETGPGPGPEEPAGGEETAQASVPAARGVPGAQGPQEEQPGESSADSVSDTDSDSSSSVSSSSCSLSIGSVECDSQQNGNDNTSYHVKTKDELPLERGPPPVEDLTIILPEDVELKPFGTVSSIIEQLVIIESLKGLPPVNEESIIFKGDRHAAGKIYEIFGPVLHPFYVLLFNSPEHIEAKGINIQDTVYFAPSVEDFTQYIFTEKLKQEKGSDASWKHDQEPPPEALDFSDDETERQRKQKKKKAPNQERKKPKSEVNESSE
uniref:H/ACA ribonucleoprotein complex non-core subunit NAF1 n=1 Tax=Gopherus evgoodei TaxID=1825980 RepID=A0A8C4W8F6_9SAUR